MERDPLRKADAAVNRFINKATKRNEPLEAFRETESFQQLHTMLQSGLKKQAAWVAKNLDQVPMLGDDVPAADADNRREWEHNQVARVGTWLARQMPRMNQYASQDKAYTYLFNAFTYSVQAQYLRLGFITKAAKNYDFHLTNEYYISELKDQSNYLLHKSQIDETTRQNLISVIRDHKLDGDTIDEIANAISDQFDEISDGRAFRIANTETNQAMSSGNLAFMTENNVPTKVWVPAGGSTCALCQSNADDGPIPTDQAHSSGDMAPPGHPSCECYEDAGEIDLESIDPWDGS